MNTSVAKGILRRTSNILMACVLASCVLDSSALFAEESGLIASGAKVKLVKGDFEFIEGPVSDADGTFFFTDIDANKIYKMSLDGKFSVIRESSNHANGMSLDLDGNLLMCEHVGQCISRMKASSLFETKRQSS